MFVPVRVRKAPLKSDPDNFETVPGTGVRLTGDTLDEIRKALLDLNPDDTEAVQRFLERWGLLGIGCPVNTPKAGLALLVFGPRQWFEGDGVEAARECLREFQRLAYGDDPEPLAAFWCEASALEDARLRFYLTWRLTPTGVAAEGGPFTLAEALCVAVGAWARRPARRCANARCGRLLLVADRRQRFCSYDCYNRAHVRASKRKKRALGRLAQGDTAAAVAARFGIDAKEVRRWAREARSRKRSRRKR
ncbi:MAG: CGNR zinc finger domain-containing protein [Candidatus Rokubacteria bacterium]|nr:CGNR zinc finger domain-containing protein [Candidatus Rokubacteria bacterium]